MARAPSSHWESSHRFSHNLRMNSGPRAPGLSAPTRAQDTPFLWGPETPQRPAAMGVAPCRPPALLSPQPPARHRSGGPELLCCQALAEQGLGSRMNHTGPQAPEDRAPPWPEVLPPGPPGGSQSPGSRQRAPAPRPQRLWPPILLPVRGHTRQRPPASEVKQQRGCPAHLPAPRATSLSIPHRACRAPAGRQRGSARHGTLRTRAHGLPCPPPRAELWALPSGQRSEGTSPHLCVPPSVPRPVPRLSLTVGPRLPGPGTAGSSPKGPEPWEGTSSSANQHTMGDCLPPVGSVPWLPLAPPRPRAAPVGCPGPRPPS